MRTRQSARAAVSACRAPLDSWPCWACPHVHVEVCASSRVCTLLDVQLIAQIRVCAEPARRRRAARRRAGRVRFGECSTLLVYAKQASGRAAEAEAEDPD
eukprot:2616736-Pleurochrysis_carterae.AAC.1